jgi:hypothetical protein
LLMLLFNDIVVTNFFANKFIQVDDFKVLLEDVLFFLLIFISIWFFFLRLFFNALALSSEGCKLFLKSDLFVLGVESLYYARKMVFFFALANLSRRHLQFSESKNFGGVCLRV